jgi:hypothetical protein
MKTDAGYDVSQVLDEGIVVAGTVEVKLFGLKVLPVKVNLLVSSARGAERLGLSWWETPGRGADEKPEKPQHPAAGVVRHNGAPRRRPRPAKRA